MRISQSLWKVGLVVAIAAVSSTIAYFSAVARTSARTAAIEAKVTELETKLAEQSAVKSQPVEVGLPLDPVEPLKNGPPRDIPRMRALLISNFRGSLYKSR